MATALSVDYATLVDSLVELDARNLDFVDKNVPLDKETLLKVRVDCIGFLMLTLLLFSKL